MQLILSIAAIHLLACLSPGPDIFLVIRTSIRNGWRKAVLTTTGILTGVCIHIFLGIGGVSLLISQNEGIKQPLSLAGGSWLLYLGMRGLLTKPKREFGNAEKTMPVKTENLGRYAAWQQGLLVNLLNPKALLFFLSLFSVMLGPEVPIRLRMGSGATMIVVQFLAFSMVAILIDRPGSSSWWASLQLRLDQGISVVLSGIGIWIWIGTLHAILT